MTSKLRPQFRALALDCVIFALLVFYKLNFVFPSVNQFVFSGDFVRPITTESAIGYYIHPFVLNEHGTFVDPNAIMKMPYWLPIIFASYFTSLNVAYWLLIVATQILSCLLISTSTRTLFSPEKKISYYMIPLIPSIFACFSFPMNYRPYWLYLPLLPGLLQCMVIISYKALSTRRVSFQTKLLLILFGYLASLQVHVIALILITLASVFFFFLLQKRELSVAKVFSQVAFWLCLPFLCLLINTFVASFSAQALSPEYIYTYSVLKFMSSRAESFVNVFTFSTGFWEKVVYTNTDKMIALLVVSSVVMFYSSVSKKSAYFLSVFLAFVVSLSFEMGIVNPIYKLIADPSNPFAWLLRDPFKVSLISLGLFTTIFSFLLRHSATIAELKKRRLLATVLVAVMVLSIVVWSPNDKTGEIIQPSTIPKEYFVATNYLNEHTEGPLLFLPVEGSQYEWAENPYLQESFLAKSYQGNYIDYTATTSREVKEFLLYATSTKNLRSLSLVTSGIVVDTSLEGIGDPYCEMAKYIANDFSGESVRFGDNLYFLPIQEYSRFRTVEDPILIITPIDYKYVGSSSEFSTENRGILFLDYFDRALQGAVDIKLSSKLAAPSIAWSVGYTHEPLHGAWHYYLDQRGLSNWQSDYGKGLVFTWAEPRLKENPRPANDDLINKWVFDSENDLAEWKKYTKENQFGALCPLVLDNKTLKVELWNSTWGWKTIDSPLISAGPGDWYRWQLKTKGEDVYELHVKIVEYNAQKEIINAKQVKSLGSGSFDWQTVTVDFAPENPETKYMQLQIWHGNETTQPLPNRIWIDDVEIFSLRRFAEPVMLETPFKVQNTDEYVFLARYFENQQGGEVQIQLDDKNYTITTKDQLNKFVWKEIDTRYLEAGQHKSVLANLQGFNAVNVLALVPKSEYQKNQNQLQQFLEGKETVYILEAESDMYGENTTVSSKYEGKASNGEVLELTQLSGKVWNEIEILEPGNYTIAIRGRGNQTIRIDETEYSIDSSELDWTFLGPISLLRGKHAIEIKMSSTPNRQPSELDVVWLYSTEKENETLEDIFSSKENPAQIVSYQKIDPTKYTAVVNATKPFMLTFAEPYDPLWVAYIDQERVHSEPLFSVINSFWINQTGQLEITIEYEPQRWFYYGSIISATIFFACIAYLVISYAKDKDLPHATRKMKNKNDKVNANLVSNKAI